MSRVRYRAIADDLRTRVGAGEFAAGRLLPSESELSAAYAASRITVRRALELLREESLIDSRQGLGWFVAADPLRQSLARLGTIEAQLAESGVTPTRRVLDFGFVAAPARVRRILGVRRVLEVRRVTLADDHPFAHVTVWCPEALGKQLSLADVEATTFYELIRVPLGDATQTIAAGAATPSDADVLGVPNGSPVLVCRRTTRGRNREPVLYSEHVFAGHRTEFVIDLPHADRSIAPTGLRLVE